MRTRWLAAGLCVGLVACAAYRAGDRPVFLYEGPDRPGGEEIEGPAPPSDYKFGPSESPTASKRVIDTNDDQRGDLVEYLSNGEVFGSAQDTNFDGKVDVYKKISHGMVVEEVRDRNFDGVLDVRSRDTNGDGKLDLTEPLTP